VIIAAAAMGIALCLFVEAFFSGSEIAMMSASRVALQTSAAAGHGGARLALRLLEREDRLISTCLIGTNIAVVSGTTLAAVLVGAAHLTPIWVIAYVPLTVTLGEALPKTVFEHHAERLAPLLAYALRAAQGVFLPMLLLAGAWTTALRRVAKSAQPLTRQDIVDLLEDEDAAIDPEEQQMIRRVFRMNSVDVEDAMTPLVDVRCLPVTASLDDAVEVALAGGHSRLPIYEDRVDNVVGLLEMHDLIYDGSEGDGIKARMRSITFVPESKRADELLHEMRHRREHFAVVVDEYGGSVGIVTIEDLLEEIIGEIRDERDEDEPGLRQVGPNTWRIPARTEVDEVAEALGVTFAEGDYETIAGFVLRHLGRIPIKGEQVALDGLVLRVDDANERAIVSMTATLTSSASDPAAP